MRLNRTMAAVAGIGLAMSLAACAERTTGQKIRDTLDPPSGPAESVGRSMDRTVNSITKP